MTTRTNTSMDNRERRLQGIIENRPYLGPQTVHFDIANGCNVRCTTCWHHSPALITEHVPSAEWKRKQLSFDVFKGILDDLIELGGLEQIILSGMGDPSLNDQLIEMVRYAHRHGIGVTIITNLLRVDLKHLLQDQVSIQSGLLNLLVSICGVTPTTWNDFHAMPAGFDKLIEQLAILKEAKFLPKHVQVINSLNYHELDQMVRFAEAWPAKQINFKFASLANGTERYALSEGQKRTLLHELIPRAKAIAAFRGIETDLTAFATQISLTSHRTSPIEEVGCFMGTIYCRITVDLELLYCCNTEVSVGFLTDGIRFKSLWNGPAYQSLRARLGNGNYFASCQQCGKYKQNLKWSERLGGKGKKLPPTPFSGSAIGHSIDLGESDS